MNLENSNHTRVEKDSNLFALKVIYFFAGFGIIAAAVSHVAGFIEVDVKVTSSTAK
jgi:hypothetical protein